MSFRFSSSQLGSRAAILACLIGCAPQSELPHSEPPSKSPTYRASIQRTQHGIPHITAGTIGSAGFGQGYALAEDHACTLADQILKVRGERAKYLGEGTGRAYVVSDFAYRLLDLPGRAQVALQTQPPAVRELVQGYVAGFNKYLADTGIANIPGFCKGQPWVRPITETELFAYDINVALTGSSAQLIAGIGAAQPPGSPATGTVDTHGMLERLHENAMGSNGWAIGSHRSKSGMGMVVANPHFPWEGEMRMWESHLTVPGELDVYGVSVIGLPGVLLGFNRHVAWTHTFSAGERFTGYALRLVPGKPTYYFYGDQERAMTEHPITVAIRQPDGTSKDEFRTYYSTHYGPVLSIPTGLPGEPFVWNTKSALTYRDANADNASMAAQFHGMDKARSLEEFKSVFANVQGIPWVNTIAADRQGNAWYADASPTPNLGADTLGRLAADLANPDTAAAKAFARLFFIVLDGSDPKNEWVPESGARSPGLVPFARVPKLSRNDFVFNSNDSHWLANPAEPLVGYSFLHGLEGKPQSPRTRMNATYLTEIAEKGASGPDGKFTLDELEATVLGNRNLTAELLLPQVVARCKGKKTGHFKGKSVDIVQACTLLANWNGRFDLDSVGAIVWRELMGAYASSLYAGGELFATPFDPSHPIETPHTLKLAPAGRNDPLLDALAQAVETLKAAKIPLDAPLGKAQFTVRGPRKQRFGLHGSNGSEGTTNVVTYGASNNSSSEERYSVSGPQVNYASHTGLTADGYVVNYGSCFIMAMEFTPDGVRANALLTYGESANQDSKFFADQTEMFQAKQWRKVLFSQEDIAADPSREKLTIEQ